MSRRILVSLGSLAVLASAACALSFLDLNFAKTIEEEEDREFSLNTEEQPNIPAKPLDEETHTQEPLIQRDDPEVTEQEEPTISQLQPPQEEEKPTTVETSPQPEPEKPPVTPPTPENSPLPKALDEEQDATSINSTVTQDNPITEPVTNLKNPAPEEAPKEKVPETPKKPNSKQNQTESKSKPKTPSSGKTQTIKQKWKTSDNNKKADPGHGIKTINLIRDYSFRLVNSCISGTIWILDYEIPTGQDKYPTKFFFGTSAQAAAKIPFKKEDDPYKQELPEDNTNCTQTRIIGETDINYGGADHFRGYKWNQNEHGVLDIKDNDNNNVKNWLDHQPYQPPYFYYDVSNVKLAYVATDFAGSSKDSWGEDCPNKDKPYMADFAVIEVDFGDSKTSKAMTRDFYTKHKNSNNTTIDFFAQSLMERKTNEKLYEESTDIYIAGYSQNGLKGRSSGSFDLDNLQASKLTYSDSHKMINYNDEGEILGHAHACHSQESISGYGSSARYLRGVEIVVSHDSLEEGSLGSLAIDSEGKAIGVKSRYTKGKDKAKDKISSITSFRSKEIKKGNKVIIPSYDLLSGSSNSYKSSILNANKQTYLRQKQNWRTKK